MNLPLLITDNITELLLKILKFTQMRERILRENINNFHAREFVPKDLTVEEFSEALNEALGEYVQKRRLMFRDRENIKFGVNGNFEAWAVEDAHAQKLLMKNPDAYLKLQLRKLFENTINQRMTRELLKQKEGIAKVF
jgi:flagellar basal body rod protein FlgB